MKKILKIIVIYLIIIISFNNIQAAAKPSWCAQVQTSFNDSSWWAKGVIITGAAVAGAWVAKKTYDYFFELSDLQEIERALRLIEKNTAFEKKMAFAYHNEQQMIYATLHATPKNYDDATIVTFLKNKATSKFTHHPYYNYALQLKKDIKQTKEKQQELAETKLRLFERKLRLLKLDDITQEQKASLISQYNEVIQKIDTIHDIMQELHYGLQEIRAYMIHTIEYKLELKQEQIEILQQENLRLKQQAIAGSAALAYAYTAKPQTQVTQINVHHNDYTTSSSNNDAISTPQVGNCPACTSRESDNNAQSAPITHIDPQVATYEQFRDEAMMLP